MTDGAAAETAGGNRRLLIGVVVLLVVGGIGWALIQSAQAEATAPDFTLTDTGWENGTFRGAQEFSLSDYRGKTVVLDWMAFNCGSCRLVSARVIEPTFHAFGDRDDFAILTLDAGDFSGFPGSNHDNLVAWQMGNVSSVPAAAWRHALDTEGAFLDYLEIGAIGMPSVFVVGPDGAILYGETGIPDKDKLAHIITQSFEGEAEQAQVLQAGVIGLAFVAGIASFFAPCSVGLIPAYMGFLLARKAPEPLTPGAGRPGAAVMQSIGPGLQTAAGIVVLYGVLAIVVWAAGDLLAPAIPKMGLVVGGLLVALGVLMLIGFDWERVAKWMGLGKVDGRKGFFAFGVGYGLAAFGCTGPIFLPVLILGFGQGAFIGFLAFLVYALAVSSLVVVAAYLVSAGQQSALRRLLSHTKAITRVSAVLLIAAGAYLLWFDATVFGL